MKLFCLLLLLCSANAAEAFSISSMFSSIDDYLGLSKTFNNIRQSWFGGGAMGADSTTDCPIISMNNPIPSQFQGKVAEVNRNWVDAITRINQYAITADVHIYITSSYRKNANVSGAIVPPASKSNHMVGHAIDMNVVYSGGFCNSVCLSGTMPGPVLTFINLVRSDPDLRWGGDFTVRDVVHIDDGLNLNNASEWDREYIQAQKYCP